MRRLECAIAVSYLHARRGMCGRNEGKVLLDSEYADLGEWPGTASGEGSLEPMENFLTWGTGVEGTELD